MKQNRLELIENEISVLNEAIRLRKVKLEELQEDIKMNESQNEFYERIVKIRREELDKLKRNS